MDFEDNQPENTVTEALEAPETNQTPTPEPIAQTENFEEEDDDSLPFPNARVVRMIRGELQSGKQLRGEVKNAANMWLGEMISKVAKEMDNSPYGSIGLADFNRAIRPFEMIDHLVKDRNHIVIAIDKLIADADKIKRDLRRFYTDLTGKEQAPQQ